MSKFNCSKTLKIYKLYLLTILFLLLTFSFLSKETLVFNNNEKNLRKLDAEKVCFTIFRLFDYFFYCFFLLTFFAPCLCCFEQQDNEFHEVNRNLAFFTNKIIYIINVGYIIISGINCIYNIEFRYSLSIFILSSLYFLISSTTYVIMSLKCKEKCFPGICQWGYLKKMLAAPCCFFAPCKERECRRIFQSEEGRCDFCFGAFFLILVGCYA